MSSIHIKKSHKGRFTKWASAHGMTVQEAASKIMHHKDAYSAHVRMMANFAKNAKHFKHAYGGQIPAEVEGGEVAEKPNGQLLQFNGASHEQGGIDTTLPQGTDIYSSRISIDGETMAERKKARENSLNKLKKAQKRRPVDALIKNGLQRKEQINAIEEAQDMAIQEHIGNILQQPMQKKAYGGMLRKYAYGLGNSNSLNHNTDDIPLEGGNYEDAPTQNILPSYSRLLGSEQPYKYPYAGNGTTDTSGYTKMMKTYSNPSIGRLGSGDNLQTDEQLGQNNILNIAGDRMQERTVPNMPNMTSPNSPDSPHAPMTAGNYLGMIGTAANAIMPLLNTKNYYKNRIKPTNPYVGYNHDALTTNENEMSYLAKLKDFALSNSSQSRANAINRNNNSTRSVNVQRALNSGADIAFNNDENQINQGFAAQTMGVLDKRTKLLSDRDNVVMSGNASVQAQNKADYENYMTQIGKDYTNAGSGLQKEGLALNEQQHNQDFLSLLPSLSKYGLAITYVNGKPKLIDTKDK